LNESSGWLACAGHPFFAPIWCNYASTASSDVNHGRSALNKAFGALDSQGQALLEREIMALLDRFNTAGNASLVVPSEYLEAVIVKRSA